MNLKLVIVVVGRLHWTLKGLASSLQHESIYLLFLLFLAVKCADESNKTIYSIETWKIKASSLQSTYL